MFRGLCCFFFQAEDGIRYYKVTGVQTCALPISQPRSGARLADADPMSIDWTALGEEAVDLLRRYLMIDTTNPPGNEADGATFLAAVLERGGIASEIVEAKPRRAHPMARPNRVGPPPGILPPPHN